MTTATAAGVTAATADVTTAEDVTAEDMTTTPSVTGGGSMRGPVETMGTNADDCGTGGGSTVAGVNKETSTQGGDRQLVEHHGGGLLGVHCDIGDGQGAGHECDGHGARGCGQWVGHDGGSRGWLGRTGQERADGWARSGLKRQVGKIQQMDRAV